MCCIVPLFIVAQTKVAVYVTGEDPGINAVLGNKLINIIGKSERSFLQSEYAVIERQKEFLTAIAAEQAFQRSGAVNDDEIARVGKQFGAQLVCVTVIRVAFELPFISVRLIDVETAEVEGTAMFSGMLGTIKDVINAGDSLGKNLMSSIKNRKTLAWKKVAVYVTQTDASKNIANVLGDVIVSGFTNTGRFVAIERTDKFLSLLNAEHDYQRSGALDDEEISHLGKLSGVDYVCVVDVTDVLGEKYISARMVNVETAAVINTHEADGKLDNIEECISVANQIAQKLSKGTYMEQRYEEGSFMGGVLFPSWLQNFSPVDIPNWFMDLSDGAYVGISMPAGNEMDAVIMALIQKIIATDHYITYDAKYNQKKVDGGRKGALTERMDSVSFSINADISYNIQELSLLSTGEYICRITDGNRNKVHFTFTVDNIDIEVIRVRMKNKEHKRYVDKQLKIAYNGNKSQMGVHEDSKNDTVVYRTYYQRDNKDHHYLFKNEVKNIGDLENVKMLYKFPQMYLPIDSAYMQYRYIFESNKSLAEQLLQYYIDIIRKPLPRNYKTDLVWNALRRKATPINSMLYENGEMIINCRKE